jgi:hypothetical protein
MWLENRVFLEKLTGSQLVKKFPTVYWIRKYFTAFTTARHLSLFWDRSIQSVLPFPCFEELFWYDPPINAWVFKVVSFLQISPPKPCMHVSFPPYVLYTPPIPHVIEHIYKCTFVGLSYSVKHSFMLGYRTRIWAIFLVSVVNFLYYKTKSLPEFLLVIIPCKRTGLTMYNTNRKKCFRVRGVCRWFPLARLMGCFCRRYVMMLLSHVSYLLST